MAPPVLLIPLMSPYGSPFRRHENRTQLYGTLPSSQSDISYGRYTNAHTCFCIVVQRKMHVPYESAILCDIPRKVKFTPVINIVDTTIFDGAGDVVLPLLHEQPGYYH